MPIIAALRLASSKSSIPQQLFACGAFVGEYIFIVTPITSYPASARRPAATAESTPPLIAAITRVFAMVSVGQDNRATAQTPSSNVVGRTVPRHAGATRPDAF